MDIEKSDPDLMKESLTPEEATQLWKSRRKRHKGRFVGGPFLWPQFKLAAQLPGKALAVWLLVHHQSRLKRRPVVTLPGDMLMDCGISRDANKRALAALEHIGLVSVARSKGRSVRVSLVNLDTDDE